MSYCFSKKQKIKKRSEISHILYRGTKWRCREFHLYFIFNNCTYNRFAVLVSKKNGNAVVRNRIKRLFRELFRLHTATSGRRHIDLIIKPAFSLEIKQKPEVEDQFAQWLKKSGIS